MGPKKLIVICLSFFAVSCGEAPMRTQKTPVANPTPTSADGTSNLESEYFALSQEKIDLDREIATLHSKDVAEKLEFKILESINQKLCERVALLRRECLPAARLLPDPSEKNLACARRTENDEDAPMWDFQVRVQGAGQTKFQLVADNSFETNVFKEGENTLTWSTPYSTLGVSPRLYEIKNLRLKAVSGPLPALDTIQFELRVNDSLLLDRASLVASGDATYYSIRTDGFLHLRHAPVCKVTAQEVDFVRSEARKIFAQAPAVTPTPLATASPEDQREPQVQTREAPSTEGRHSERDVEALKAMVASLKPIVEKLRNDAPPRVEALDRERDREGKLSRELLGEAAAGCFAAQPLEKFEIVVNGTHLEMGALFETKDAPAPSSSAAQILFNFGQNVRYTNPDEEASSIFRQQGNYVTSEFSAQNIGDIEFVSIAKGGVDYLTTEKCTQVWLFGKSCVKQNRERKRYRLDSITVKANDEVLYKKDGINFVFEGANLKWEDKNISLNPAYLSLMARSDCPVRN